MFKKDYILAILKESQKAKDKEEIPLGAIVVKNQKIIGRGHNNRQTTNEISRHAEIIAIEEAAKYLNTWKLNDCEIYTSLEPCQMCLGAINQSRITKIYTILKGNENKNYLTSDLKINYLQDGEIEEEIQQILNKFFKRKRNKNKYK